MPDLPTCPNSRTCPTSARAQLRRSTARAARADRSSTRSKGGKQVMIICTDRIERMASMDADRWRSAAGHPAHGLWPRARRLAPRAREHRARHVDCPRTARRSALEGIDEAIREMRSRAGAAPTDIELGGGRGGAGHAPPRTLANRRPPRHLARHGRATARRAAGSRTAGDAGAGAQSVALHAYRHADASGRHHRPRGDRSRPRRPRAYRRADPPRSPAAR